METIIATILLGAAWLAVVVIIATIIQRLGFGAWTALFLALAALVLPFTLIVLCYLSGSEWPIEKQLRRIRMGNGKATPNDLQKSLRDAIKLEARANVPAAIKEYRLLIQSAPATAEAEEAANNLRILLRDYPELQMRSEELQNA